MPHLILDGYQAMLDNGLYPASKVVLSSFVTYPRFAGPREAVRGRCSDRSASTTASTAT